METPFVLAAFAGLLITIAMVQPLARKLDLSPTVLLATVGTLIGIGATYLLYTPRTDVFNEIALVFVDLPLDAQQILYIFLPLLLFQTSLTLDVRRTMEDVGPILLMAVVAVFVATAFIGLALYPLSNVPLLACLLLGSIVATTDPVAVVAIFRDIGAPARLTRIVEGESLLNDAAAVVLFVLILGLLTRTREMNTTDAILAFFRAFSGGILAGIIIGRLFVFLLPLLRGMRLAQVTLSLALPYLLYVLADQVADVSAVVAVVMAGIIFNLYGPSRISPENWTFLQDIWEQIAYWASSLIFILAAILIPRLVQGFQPIDILLLVVLVLSALAARAVVIFGLMPLLTIMRIGQVVDTKFKVVMLWGGMRGAITLVLALSVSEHLLLEDGVSEFVTKLATGFVLFTLLVYGPSLKPLIKVLKLDQLTARDQALTNQFLALALSDVRQELAQTARAYHISPQVARQVTKEYEARIEEVRDRTTSIDDLKDKERVTLGLIALSEHERELVLQHFREKTISSRGVSLHLAEASRISDLTRQEGRPGYNRAVRSPLKFGVRFRIAQFLHRTLRIQSMLAMLIADRFEYLIVSNIIAEELVGFNQRRVRPLIGERVGDILNDTLSARRDEVKRAIDALRLQYPDYADAQERLFLRRTGIRIEETAYHEAHAHTLIGSEVFSRLKDEIQDAQRQTSLRPRLDLGLKTDDLISQHGLFSDLPPDRRQQVAKLMKPRFATPGEKLIGKGDRGDAAYFISSGAVEVRAPNGDFRLGRGDMFGEIALITGKPRTADVVALGYCQLLVLTAADYRRLVETAPDIKAHMDDLSSRRETMNAGTLAGVVPAGMPGFIRGAETELETPLIVKVGPATEEEVQASAERDDTSAETLAQVPPSTPRPEDAGLEGPDPDDPTTKPTDAS
ncbi:cation:proton antiporter [Roseibium sp.]|uniref:cation:proton antiporter n=1 Tax=Roseibium sp. TaxID=1936156 RepID=UPI003A97F065